MNDEWLRKKNAELLEMYPELGKLATGMPLPKPEFGTIKNPRQEVEYPKSCGRNITVDLVKLAALTYFGTDDMNQQSLDFNARGIVRGNRAETFVRNVAWFMAWTLIERNHYEIYPAMWCTKLSTYLYGCQSIEQRIIEDIELRELIEDVMGEIIIASTAP